MSCFFLIVLGLKIYITEIMQLNCCFWAQGTSHVNITDEIVSQVPNWCGLCLFRAFLISTGLLEGNKEHCLYSLHCTQCLGVLWYRHKPHVCQILLWMLGFHSLTKEAKMWLIYFVFGQIYVFLSHEINCPCVCLERVKFCSHFPLKCSFSFRLSPSAFSKEVIWLFSRYNCWVCTL